MCLSKNPPELFGQSPYWLLWSFFFLEPNERELEASAVKIHLNIYFVVNCLCRLFRARDQNPARLLWVLKKKTAHSRFRSEAAAAAAERVWWWWWWGKTGTETWMIIRTGQTPPPLCLLLSITLTSHDGQNADGGRGGWTISSAQQPWGKVSNGCLLLF